MVLLRSVDLHGSRKYLQLFWWRVPSTSKVEYYPPPNNSFYFLKLKLSSKVSTYLPPPLHQVPLESPSGIKSYNCNIKMTFPLPLKGTKNIYVSILYKYFCIYYIIMLVRTILIKFSCAFSLSQLNRKRCYYIFLCR